MTGANHESYYKRILNILIYIQNHLDDNLSLEHIADIAHFSPYHFHRIFTAIKGESVKNYIRRLRLQRASKDLIYTKKTIAQIAKYAGYNSQQSFHHAFQEIFNITPAAFRKLRKNELLEKNQVVIDKLNNQIPIADRKVSVIDFPDMPVAFVRHTGPLNTMLNSWFELAEYVGVSRLLTDSPHKKISIFYDDPNIIPADKLRFDACITTEGADIEPKSRLGFQTLNGGKYAFITHYGNLKEINDTFIYLYGTWLPQSNYEIADSPNLMYHRMSPFETKSEELETDIFMPLTRIIYGS